MTKINSTRGCVRTSMTSLHLSFLCHRELLVIPWSVCALLNTSSLWPLVYCSWWSLIEPFAEA